MLKFLVYLFVFYVVSRFLFGGLFKVKVYNFNQYNQPNQPGKNSEGTITIKDTGNKNNTQKTEKIGEYVDYEEVK